MKKLMIKTLLIGLLSVISIASYAASDAWTGWYPVDQVQTTFDGTLYFSLDPWTAQPNPAGCISSAWFSVEFSSDQQNRSEIYQMVLTAQAAGLRLNAQVSGTGCSGSHLKVLHLRTHR